jgi:hypothetical protein
MLERSQINWDRTLKLGFLVSVLIWILGATIQFWIFYQIGNSRTLLNLHTVAVNGFGSLSIVLGFMLLVRWIVRKQKQ